MPTFIYTAKSINDGRNKSGGLEAENKAQLAHLLREEGFLLTSAELAGQKRRQFSPGEINLPFLNSVSLTEKMLFARHLSVMVSAGLSLTRALEVLAKQTKNRRFSKTISQIAMEVQGGKQFADALKDYPKIFSEIFVNMIAVGETSGNLEEVLMTLASQMKKDHELISRVKGAMTYPAVILIAMIGIGISMMIFVMPKLISVFEEMQIELPLTTRLVIGLSEALNNHLFISLGGGALLAAALVWIFRSGPGQKVFQAVLLKTPIFGGISKKVNSARLAGILSSLVKSGVPIVKSLKITGQTLKNRYFRESLQASSEKIQKGESLSQTLAGYENLYPPMVIQMIKVGEETGTLSEILEKLAEFYEEEISNITKNLSSIIEPILMILIGAAVGFFAISMLTPMYSLMGGI